MASQSKTTRSGPGRPAKFHRDAAIDAAMQLLWEQGFSSVTVRDLAHAMGIQRSSFYNSFGRPEDVFKEALERYAHQAPDAPLDTYQPGQPALPLLVGVLKQVCRERAADAKGRGCLACNSIAELVGHHDTLGPLLENAWARRTASLTVLLREAESRQEIQQLGDAEVAAEGIAVFLLGLNTASKMTRREDRLWALCEDYLRRLKVAEEYLVRADALGDALASSAKAKPQS